MFGLTKQWESVAQLAATVGGDVRGRGDQVRVGGRGGLHELSDPQPYGAGAGELVVQVIGAGRKEPGPPVPCHVLRCIPHRGQHYGHPVTCPDIRRSERSQAARCGPSSSSKLIADASNMSWRRMASSAPGSPCAIRVLAASAAAGSAVTS